MRIAVFADHRRGSTPYRAFEPMFELGRRGHGVLVDGDGMDVTSEVVACDVAFVQRYQGVEAERRVRKMKAAGLAVVWDHDDAVTQLPDAKRRTMHGQLAIAGTRGMCQLADVVTTPSTLLAEQYRAMGAERVRVIENHLIRAYDELAMLPHRGIVVGWIAWGDHQRDWDGLGLREPATRLLERHPDVRFESVGPIDLRIDDPRYQRRPPVGFERLAQEIARFDIGIAPLLDEPFNRGRSNVKAKEYAGAGIPWLASPVGPYAGLGEAQGGRLVDDDRWFEELDALVTRPRQRRKLAKKGRKWARDHMLATRADEWERALAEAIEVAAARRAVA